MQPLPHNSHLPPPLGALSTEIGALITRLLDGEEDAWPLLMAQLHPMVIDLCGHRLRASTDSSEDICRDVASKTLERLQKSNYGALRRYQETRVNYPSLRFSSWLRAVVGNVCIDHLRSLPGHQRVGEANARRHQIHSIRPLTEETADATDLQRNVEISRVLAWLSDAAFPSDQRQALSLWMRGHNATEIASIMELPSQADATRLLRAGRQRLRRRFEEC